MVRRLSDAATANVGTATSGQHHVDQLNLAQFLEHATRFMPQADSLATLAQRFPENVGQEADQNVGQDSLFFLMPDWTQPEVALVDAERRLGLCQLDTKLRTRAERKNVEVEGFGAAGFEAFDGDGAHYGIVGA